MDSLVGLSGHLDYDGFSADDGVCDYGLDEYKKLGVIEELTLQYLELPEIKQKLQRVAADVATDYIKKRYPTPVSEPLPFPQYNFTEQNTSNPCPSSSKRPETPIPALTTGGSLRSSSERSENRTPARPNLPHYDVGPGRYPVEPRHVPTSRLPAEATNDHKDVMQETISPEAEPVEAVGSSLHRKNL